MNLWPGTRHRLPAAVAACGAVALGLVACGGSTPTSSSGSNNEQLALAQCMRAHGVSNFPDPIKGPGGEGFSITKSPGSTQVTVGGVSLSGPAFRAAEKTCRLFGGGTSPPPITEHEKLKEYAFSRCMRRHGVPSFPDPRFPAGGGIERPRTSGINRNSPAFQKAATICNQ